LGDEVKVAEGGGRGERGVLHDEGSSQAGEVVESAGTDGAKESGEGGGAESTVVVSDEGGISEVVDVGDSGEGTHTGGGQDGRATLPARSGL
jgi:hypothetical protein